jgi:predicted nucleotidyltransferase component of viral defense system
MLTQAEVQRFARESGLRDIMIAEKEIVLTYLLQLLSERGLLKKFAFKGGTCLRKMYLGSQGRFSTDLDFTSIEEHDHEDVILELMDAFEQPFHGLKFSIPDDSYYETGDGLSWGVNSVYTHDWNKSGESEIKLQISKRETPTLPLETRVQCDQSYFKLLPFKPVEIDCLALDEMLAEKIRACYQRNKARDMYDLAKFATRPLDQARLRKLVVIKLWQAGDRFDPQKLIDKMGDESAFDWGDLAQLTRQGQAPDHKKIMAYCVKGYAFLTQLTPDEKTVAEDQYHRSPEVYQRVVASLAG